MWVRFSLRRLAINFTVLCVVLSVIVSHPSVAMVVAIYLVKYGPALLVWAVAIWRSRQPIRTFAVVTTFSLFVLAYTSCGVIQCSSVPSTQQMFDEGTHNFIVVLGFAVFDCLFMRDSDPSE